MSKLTPGISRLAAILRLFARDPARRWSLSEIVEELGISRSTCHALLLSLDLADLAYRDEDKRYVLGSLAVEIGRAAADRYSPAELVQHELTELSREWGTISASHYRRQNAILIREWIDPMRGSDGASRAGVHIPLAPPWGTIFYAWESRAEQRRWLEAVRDDTMREQIAQALSGIRRQGFMCGLRLDHIDPNRLDMNWDRVRYHTDPFFVDPQPDKSYALDFLAAPVFAMKRATMAIAVTGFCAPMTGVEIQDLAAKLKARCRKIGHFLDRAEPSAL